MTNSLDLPRQVIDFETRSELDVTEVGACRYAEHPSTEIISLTSKLKGGDEKILWTPPNPFPQELIEHAEAGNIFEAHGAMFEQAIWYNILHKRNGVPMPSRWVDTLASCAYRGLPLKLDHVGDVLNLDVKKDRRGKYLIQQLSTPRKPLKAEKKVFKEQGIPEEEWPVLWREDWGLTEEMYDYNGLDVDSEDNLGDVIGDLPMPEYRLWVLDQTINWRGVYVDIEAVEAAIEIVEEISEKMTVELVEITGGAVRTANQVAAIRKWLKDNDFEVADLTKDTVQNLLENEYILMPDDVKRVLEIRRELGRSSTKKLYKFRECLCNDMRLRGLLQYHGAGTGRWSGRLVQPQNFPRGTVTNRVNDKGKKWLDMDLLIEHIKLRDVGLLELIYGSPMEAIASSLRGMFIAAPGKKLRVADFSAIEARVTMWMACQEDALEAFRLFDRGEGPDIYCVMAEDIYGRPIDKKDDPDKRQLGKITILGCGYQMGWPKLQFQAEKDYGVKLEDSMAEFLVTTYRDKYYKVKWLWYGVEEAAVKALELNKPVSYSYVTFEPVEDAAGKWLTCILPNGRRLWYFRPQIEDVLTPWGQRKKQVGYEGRDNKKGGAWGRIRTYGGMLTENIVQAISRDLMAEAMIRVEKKGYHIILTVHDEIVAENDKDFGDQKEFERLMTEVPVWAKGCPISVEGWEGTRYKKG